MERLEEYKPIGSDPIKIYGFRFGRYRYQVEHFNHVKKEDEEEVKNGVLRYIDIVYGMHGTRIYRFLDWECDTCIHSALYFDDYIEEDELKKMILDDVIDWKIEDPYDFKDRFITDRFNVNTLFQREKDDVKLPYPECKYPYEKCPICGGELDYSVLEIENAEDIFNSHVGTNYEGEPDGWWHEVHRCPHCDKLFYIEECC